MDRLQKQQVVAQLKENFNEAASVVVVHYSGLSVAEATELRAALRELGATFKVAKNKLVKIALEDTPYASMKDLFSGPTAIAFSQDPVSAAKGVVKFANDNKNVQILGGAMGEQLFDVEQVKALAKLPSLDELRGKIVGILGTPATRVASVVQAPAGQLARVFSAYSEAGS